MHNRLKNWDFWKNDDGIATVELILILVVLIAVVLIFKEQITQLVGDIFDTITDQAGKV
ncbi:MAG: hypothetical protein E7277_09295 [Lachnospiraceae bacterium]|nr:hypothetical protein [Lachnospiraceae bacterium]